MVNSPESKNIGNELYWYVYPFWGIRMGDHADNQRLKKYKEIIDDAKPFGMFALNSLRIEKGYRAWKGDLSTDYSLLRRFGSIY